MTHDDEKQAPEAVDKAFDASHAGEPGPGREPSAAEHGGVSDTDMAPSGPHGVGESMTRRPEEVAAEGSEGRYGTGTQGPSQRPTGASTPEDSTGVDPKGPIDEGSPTTPTGDQGG